MTDTKKNTVLLFAQSRTCAEAAQSFLKTLFPDNVIKTKYYQAAISVVDVCATGFDASAAALAEANKDKQV